MTLYVCCVHVGCVLYIMFLHQVCWNLFIRSTFGDVEVAIEMNKKEKRGGPRDMLPLAEFIDASVSWSTACVGVGVGVGECVSDIFSKYQCYCHKYIMYVACLDITIVGGNLY